MAQLVLAAPIERAAAVGVDDDRRKGRAAAALGMAASRRMDEMSAAAAMMRRMMDKGVTRVIAAAGVMIAPGLRGNGEERR